MKCPKCSFVQELNPEECPRCGIIFEKYHQFQARKHPSRIHEKPDLQTSDSGAGIAGGPQIQDEADVEWTDSGLAGLLFRPKEDHNPIIYAGQWALLTFLIFLGIRYMSFSIESNKIAASFFHLVNLPFHEAGHIFFRPFGRLVTSMGGSIMQLLMPLICMAVLLVQTRDPFGGAVTLWWFGENFLDMAPYIDDARSLSLPLLGGNYGYSSPYGFHDWEFILKELGIAHWDHTLARIAFFTGCTIMILSYIWATFLLIRQRKHLL
ncbi:MAG: zinc ribbon domain-containing protein [Desulfobacteraceae bacterium]|nr:MAG: zinc ribbon domain-containing protein [Desulfobacteraceae bacterium]